MFALHHHTTKVLVLLLPTSSGQSISTTYLLRLGAAFYVRSCAYHPFQLLTLFHEKKEKEIRSTPIVTDTVTDCGMKRYICNFCKACTKSHGWAHMLDAITYVC